MLTESDCDDCSSSDAAVIHLENPSVDSETGYHIDSYYITDSARKLLKDPSLSELIIKVIGCISATIIYKCSGNPATDGTVVKTAVFKHLGFVEV